MTLFNILLAIPSYLFAPSSLYLGYIYLGTCEPYSTLTVIPSSLPPTATRLLRLRHILGLGLRKRERPLPREVREARPPPDVQAAHLEALLPRVASLVVAIARHPVFRAPILLVHTML